MEVKAKILILEDEPIIAKQIEAYLKLFGHEVVGNYDSAEEALQAVEQLKPDLILSAIYLQEGMSSIDFVRKIKNKNDDVVILYLCSNTDPQSLEEVKDTYPNGFIYYPVDKNQLKLTIDFSLHKFKEEHKKKLKKERTIRRGQQQIDELNETTQHLATATLRERDLKKTLQKTLGQLEESKKIIEKQNQNILASINYAKRIQHAIIPKIEDIRLDLPHTDWFYKPKDIVSGDFPYYYKKDHLLFFAAVDCTGHGVPGAMMSLIGHLILNDILHQTEIFTPAEVLSKLHKGIVRTLKQDAPENKNADGMDVGICCYNTLTKKLQYSGAHRPLYLVREGAELVQFKGGKYPAGGNQHRGKNSYPNYEIELQKGDAVYFFSDGYPDQFGGPETTKIGPKKIRELLAKNASNSVTENIDLLALTFNHWMGNTKQVDDVLMIGANFDS